MPKATTIYLPDQDPTEAAITLEKDHLVARSRSLFNKNRKDIVLDVRNLIIVAARIHWLHPKIMARLRLKIENCGTPTKGM